MEKLAVTEEITLRGAETVDALPNDESNDNGTEVPKELVVSDTDLFFEELCRFSIELVGETFPLPELSEFAKDGRRLLETDNALDIGMDESELGLLVTEGGMIDETEATEANDEIGNILVELIGDLNELGGDVNREGGATTVDLVESEILGTELRALVEAIPEETASTEAAEETEMLSDEISLEPPCVLAGVDKVSKVVPTLNRLEIDAEGLDSEDCWVRKALGDNTAALTDESDIAGADKIGEIEIVETLFDEVLRLESGRIELIGVTPVVCGGIEEASVTEGAPVFKLPRPSEREDGVALAWLKDKLASNEDENTVEIVFTTDDPGPKTEETDVTEAIEDSDDTGVEATGDTAPEVDTKEESEIEDKILGALDAALTADDGPVPGAMEIEGPTAEDTDSTEEETFERVITDREAEEVDVTGVEVMGKNDI